MRFRRRVITSGIFLTFAGTALASPRVHRGPTSPHPSKSHAAAAAKPKKSAHLLTRRAAAKPAAPRGIDPDRATQIQTALVKQGYLSGAPSGHWDNDTQAAMEKLQADNGWQTKLVPDARAIIKLGLGPTTETASK